MVEKIINLLIAENIPSLNKGEMTILEGTLVSLEQVGKISVSLFSSYPDADQSRYEKINVIDIRIFPWLNNIKRLKTFSKILSSLIFFSEHILFLIGYKTLGKRVLNLMRSKKWKGYAQSDIILIGHDNTYGVTVGITYFYYLYLPLFAKLLGKTIIFYGGSILREQRPVWLWAKALKFSLKYIDLVTLRERISYERLKAKHLLNDKIIVTGDPAFLLKPASSERIIQIMKQEDLLDNSRPMVGMTMTHDIACQAFPGLSQTSSYDRHLDLMSEIVDFIIETYHARVVFVPHCLGFRPVNDDRIIAQDILKKCKNQSQIKVITHEYSAAELKGLIGHCKLFVGERVHSVINAMSNEVPSILLAKAGDQRQDIISMLGQESAICHIDKINKKLILDKIDYTWIKSDAVKKELHIQVPAIKERSLSNGKLLYQLLKSKNVIS
jgi:polysaccharide pyruvyl transferase WcaK-like protein